MGKTSDGPKVWLCWVLSNNSNDNAWSSSHIWVHPIFQAFNQVNLPDPTLNGLKVEGG